MRKVSMIRNAGMCLVAAAAVGMTSAVLAEDTKSDVAWKQIGAAPGVVGMAVANGKLFVINSASQLLACDPSAAKVEWETVGASPDGVVAMGAADGKLYVSLAANKAGRLQSRDAVTTGGAWEDIGHAWCLVGMAGVPGKIYGLVDTKELGSEQGIMVRNIVATPEDLKAAAGAARGCDGIPWRGGPDRRPPVGSLAIAAVGGKFYVATKEDLLYVGDATKQDVPWTSIGDAAGVTVLAGGDGKLFAATKNGRLLVWAPKTSE